MQGDGQDPRKEDRAKEENRFSQVFTFPNPLPAPESVFRKARSFWPIQSGVHRTLDFNKGKKRSIPPQRDFRRVFLSGPVLSNTISGAALSVYFQYSLSFLSMKSSFSSARADPFLGFTQFFAAVWPNLLHA
jgi:hypothetical protein